ncbi:MAG: hypothetical protein ACMUJM_02850 [bacterium]
MKFSLSHHIYTSRFCFETVAKTSGVSQQVQAKIEEYARAYPSVHNDSALSPFVFRGFPLPEHGDWAIMLMINVGSDLSGRQGNYLAHTFIAKDEVFLQIGNLPYIAAHLPIWTQFASRAPQGIEPLEPLIIHINPEGQFVLLELFLKTLSEEEYYALMLHLMHVLETLENTSFAFSSGPLQDTREELTRKFLNEPAPPLDVWNLWRTAALFALLPRVFQKRAIFSINEMVAHNFSRVKFNLTIMRDQSEKLLSKSASEHTKAYLNYCLRLLRNKSRGGHEQIQRFINTINKSITTPSLRELQQVFEYCSGACKSSVSDMISTMDDKARCLINILKVQPQANITLLHDALNCLKNKRVNNSIKFSLLQQTIKKIFANGTIVDITIAEEMVKFYSFYSEFSYDDKLYLFKELPKEVRLKWWREADRLNISPAPPMISASPQKHYTISEVEFQIALTDSVYDNLGWASQRDVIKRMLHILCRRNGRCKIEVIEGFFTLLKLRNPPSSSLKDDLIEKFAYSLIHPDTRSNKSEGIILRCPDALDRIFNAVVLNSDTPDTRDGPRWEMIGRLSYRLLSAYLNNNFTDASCFLLKNPQKSKYRLNAIKFLESLQLVRWPRFEITDLLIDCQIEFLKASCLQYETALFRIRKNLPRMMARDTRVILPTLPCYEKWLEYLRELECRIQDMTELWHISKIFYDNVTHEIENAPLEIALPLGISYLIASQSKESRILKALMWRLLHSNSSSIGKWLRKDKVQTGNDHVSSIMLFSYCIKSIYKNRKNMDFIEIKEKIQEIIYFELWYWGGTMERTRQCFDIISLSENIFK